MQLAAAAVGKTVDEYLRDGIPAPHDLFAAALERAADTIAGRTDVIPHDYAG
ncbi:hypothetical protein ACFWCA_19300 [Streptomyces phaeochromogenes]|uniref:hypothetical protein n=1 Tax=Streptomyces phaeochromogenes TaxID=1923 RepID=UPI0036984E43